MNPGIVGFVECAVVSYRFVLYVCLATVVDDIVFIVMVMTSWLAALDEGVKNRERNPPLPPPRDVLSSVFK